MRGVWFYVSLLAIILCMAGCQESTKSNWMLVNFEKNVPITYELSSVRKTTIDLTGGNETSTSRPQTTNESLDMIITYTPVDVDPFGLTKIEANCKSVRVKRSSAAAPQMGRDAMESMVGKTFTIQLSPTGEIVEYADLNRIIREVGQEAFDKSRTQRIKNPDMISDFIAMQWYLWDSVAMIDEPLAGLDPNDTWTAKQLIPWPAPIPNPPARITTYTLDSFIDEENQPRKALIKSRYELSETTVEGFPRPYDGTFQMRGLMGFLQNYQFESLQGEGTQIFNMENGQIESDQQKYRLNVNASFLMPLGNSLPVLTIDQTISIKKVTP